MSTKSNTTAGRRAIETFLGNLVVQTPSLKRRLIRDVQVMASNPPARAAIPPEFIVDPYREIPASWSKKKRQQVMELREIYAHAMNIRLERVAANNPEAIAGLLQPLMAGVHVEQMLLLPLDSRMKVIGTPLLVSKGDVDGTDAGPRMILRMALKADATSFAVAHNHPTGDPSPSPQDVAVTKRMIAGGKAVDCPLVDHLIIGHQKHYSMRRDQPNLWMAS